MVSSGSRAMFSIFSLASLVLVSIFDLQISSNFSSKKISNLLVNS